MTQEPFIIASAQYLVSAVTSIEAYRDKITQWVNQAVALNAKLLVFPEYFTMELASLVDETERQAPEYGVEGLQEFLPEFIGLFAELAKHHGVFICAGSYIVKEDDKTLNRSYCFNSDGTYQHQDKLIMTRFEAEHWTVMPGSGQNLWALPWGIVGVMVCYDGEFPMIAQRLVSKGAELLICPSCTDTEHGYFRVRTGCAARALENQCIVVQSVTVGNCPWSEVIDENRGAAGLFAPMDKGFNKDGIIALGKMNEAQWVIAEVDLTQVAKVRTYGAVANYQDWDKQF